MAVTALNTIKNWFKTGLKPTQAQFWNSWDSFWHKLELIPASAIEGLQALLDLKADKKDIESTVNSSPYVPGQAYTYDALVPQYVSAPDSQGTNFYQLLADASPTDVPGSAPTVWRFIGPTLGDITIADVFGLRQELDDLKENTGTGGGHVIQNNEATALTQRAALQFKGVPVADDAANGRTVVDISGKSDNGHTHPANLITSTDGNVQSDINALKAQIAANQLTFASIYGYYNFI